MHLASERKQRKLLFNAEGEQKKMNDLVRFEGVEKEVKKTKNVRLRSTYSIAPFFLRYRLG